MELLIVLAWLLLCGATAVYASRKGRSGTGVFIVSFFLSPLVGFVVAYIMEPLTPPAPIQPPQVTSFSECNPDILTKKCPDCAEQIKLEAKVCRFCGRKFELSEVEQALQEARSKAELVRPVKWWN